MHKFNLADLLSDVSGLDTEFGREQLEYIDIDKIESDARNFYALRGIDGLMSSIELLGLQQPVRVRSVEGSYVIVSGHRRCEALRRLVAEGKEEFRDVPCIVESDANSPELQELRLIFANSDTRILNSAELAQQASRVEELLYKLKEQGMEFPGRMRDHVAEACKISRTKLARLKAIDNNLAFELKLNYRAGSLNEACAYALSQMSRDDQLFIHRHLESKKCLYENSVKAMGKRLAELRKNRCHCDIREGACTHAEQLCEKLFSNGLEGYSHCKNGCCTGCPTIANCKHVCPRLADEAKAAKLTAKAAADRAKQEQAAKDAEPVRQLTALWKRFGEARIAAGLDTEEAYKLMTDNCYLSEASIKRREALELGEKVKASDESPYSYRVSLTSVKYLTAIAASFNCSIDYLLCRTDSPTVSESGTDVDVAAVWRPGAPAKSGRYVCRFDCGGQTMDRIAFYDNVLDAFFFNEHGGPQIHADLVGWWPMPEN